MNRKADLATDAHDGLVSASGALGPHARRVAWLEQAYRVLRGTLLPEAPPAEAVSLILGFPHRGARPGPRQVKGIASADLMQGMDRDRGKAIELHLKEFADPVSCLATLLHEMIHHVVGVDKGHRKAFQVLARRVGFEAPFTVANPSSPLRARLRGLLGSLPPMPPGWADLDPPLKRPTWRYRCACARPQRFQSYGMTPVEALCPHCGQRFLASGGPEEARPKALPPEAMDVNELAWRLGKSVRTIWDQVQKAKLPAPGVYLRRKAYWLPEQFDAFEEPDRDEQAVLHSSRHAGKRAARPSQTDGPAASRPRRSVDEVSEFHPEGASPSICQNCVCCNDASR